MAQELLDRLDDVKRDFREALDIDSGDGWLGEQLGTRGIRVDTLDAGPGASITADEDRMEIGEGRYDLIVSAGGLDSVNDLPGALVLIRRALRPDGLFLAGFPGGGSLPILRRAMMAADLADGGAPSPRIHPQIDVRSAGDLLSRTGFALPVADSLPLDVRYPHLPALLRDLRAMGATNVLHARDRRPLNRSRLLAAITSFAEAGSPADGRVAEHFELIFLSGWAPAESQPRPARRGSAVASLADALRKTDE